MALRSIFCNGADILTVTIYNDPPPLQDGPPQTCRRQASGPRCMSQNKNTRKGSIPPSAINRRMMIVIITNTEVIPPIPSPAWGVCVLFAPVRAADSSSRRAPGKSARSPSRRRVPALPARPPSRRAPETAAGFLSRGPAQAAARLARARAEPGKTRGIRSSSHSPDGAHLSNN